MVRRSILAGVLEEHQESSEAVSQQPVEAAPASASIKPSRRGKLHLGGYYDPHDPTLVAFQKLGIDLRKTQQEMILEAVRDYVARHEAASAFRHS